MTPHPGRPRPVARAELIGWGLALALSLIAVGQIATVSDELLFTNGDSMVVAMMARSVLAGEPQDWAMSPVLFLPETGLYAVLSLFGLGLRATLALNAVVNVLALYGAVRVAAGRAAPGRRPVAGAVVGLAVVALLAVLEGSAAGGGYQLATLQATTTYYSSTVIAAVLVVGLLRRGLDGARRGPIAAGLALLGAVSVLTNPLFVVWAVIPVLVVVGALAVARRPGAASAMILAGALAAGALAGYVARAAFANAVVAAGDNYVRFDRWVFAVGHVGGVLVETLGTVTGMLWLALVLALFVAAVAVGVRAWRRGDTSVATVAFVGAVSAVGTTAGTILIGTDADRYLQPWVFLPVLAVVAEVAGAGRRLGDRRVRRVVAVTGVLIVVLGAASVPRVVAAATRDDPDLTCVVEWVDGTDRSGAGQFWTVRAAKVRAEHPDRLVQVDHRLRPYDWLVNRAEARPAGVSYLIEDGETVPWQLPPLFTLAQADRVECGRYTILDFGDRELPLGAARN